MGEGNNLFLCYYVLSFVLICLKTEAEMLMDFVEKNLRFREKEGWFLVKNRVVFKKVWFFGHKGYLYRS